MTTTASNMNSLTIHTGEEPAARAAWLDTVRANLGNVALLQDPSDLQEASAKPDAAELKWWADTVDALPAQGC